MNVVVVGGGLAAANAIDELREQGHGGDITLVGREPHLPYERPPLSKGLLLGSAEPESVFVRPQEWYDDRGVDLRLGQPVTSIDLDRSHVVLGDAELSYDRLLLATGATPRHLAPADDAAAAGAAVVHLRTLDDALALRERLHGHVAIIGAGWIGLEVASAARQRGAEVTVLETAALPLQRVLGDELATVFADLHREHGVDLRLGVEVTGVEAAGGSRVVVRTADGEPVTADLLVVAVGVTPADDLATAAGLPTDNGVLVDARLRAADPHVFAAGDVAHHDHPQLGRIRVEHWDTAIHQGRHAARVMLGGDEPYTRLPYFFTDQYDLGVEYVGHTGPDGYDEVVVRGDLAARNATVLWISGDRVAAGMHLNDWDAIEPLRAVVGGPASAAVRDVKVPLADLA